MTPKKISIIAVCIIVLLAAAGISRTLHDNHQRQLVVEADKQRFETALTNINTFLDSLDVEIADRKTERVCGYATGPWGDVQGTLRCKVTVSGKLQDIDNKDIIARLDSNKDILAWTDTKSGLDQGTIGNTLYAYEGVLDGLSCYGVLEDTYDIDYDCASSSEDQHDPRADRR